jgi:hypothetical protein
MPEKKLSVAGISAVALFYGSLWGLAEATAGHILHLLRIPGLAGFIMFPVGFFLMSRAFSRSGRFLTIFLTSGIAAGIKLANLALPGADFVAVWNPAQAILLEGLAAAALLLVLKARRQAAFVAVLLASLSWRLAYFALSFLWVELLAAGNLFQTGPVYLFRFLFVDSIVNGFLVHFLMRIHLPKTRLPSPAEKASKLFRRPAIVATLLIAAISLELIL